MDQLYQISEKTLNSAPDVFYRALYFQLEIESQFTGITGPRGVGKSQLLLQLASQKFKQLDKQLYISLDDPRFASGGLDKIADEFVKFGGELLILDEVDKYSGIVSDMEQIGRQNADLKVLFACSSAGDDDGIIYELSRIAELYYLPGMSFREFLDFKYKLRFPVISFNELIEYNRLPGAEVLARIRPLKYFNEYLECGFFPFDYADTAEYHQKLIRTIRLNVSEDIMAAYRIDYESVLKIFRALTSIANESPFKPNIEKLADHAGTTRDSLLKFLKYLHKAGIIGLLTAGHEDVNYFNKPDRLCLGCSDLLYTLSLDAPSRSRILETFMVQSLKTKHHLNIVGSGHFKVDLEYDFIADWMNDDRSSSIPSNTYQIVDGIEARVGNRIPLWMLGFLY